MKRNAIPSLLLLVIIAMLVFADHTLVAQDSGFKSDPAAFQRLAASSNVNDEHVVARFGERTDDFLSRKIAPTTTNSESTGWALFGKPLSGYPAKKTAATVVLALSMSLLAMFVLRMKPGKRRGGLPDDVVSMLGQVPFGPNQRLQLVRLGSKLLLITSSQNGSHTLGEITDPEEVLQIESICRDGKFDTIGQTLRNRAQAAAASKNTRPRQSASMAGRTLLEA